MAQMLVWPLISAGLLWGCSKAIEDRVVDAQVEPSKKWRLAVTRESPLPGLPKVNAVAIGDFNGDHKPDIAAVNGDPGQLIILLNRGESRFEVTDVGRMSIGPTASGIVAADVNSDQRTDLMISFHDRDEVAVMLQTAEGRLQNASMQKIVRREQGNPHVHNLALADFNGDGHLDIIVAQADDNRIALAYGDGAGQFQPSDTDFPAGRHPYTITVADFNGDGRPDFAAPNAESNDLTVGLNAAAGRFSSAPGERTALPQRPLALAAGDLNGDGHIDLICSGDSNQRLTLLLGDDSGRFTRSSHYFEAPARCYGQVIHDVNGDGLSDVVAPCIDRSSVIVWLAENATALKFRRIEFQTPATDSQALAIADLDGDGVSDIVTAGWAKPTISILLGVNHTTPAD